MRGGAEQAPGLADPTAVNGCLAAPGAQLDQRFAAAIDEAMPPSEWAAFTGADALPVLRNACLEIFRVHLMPRFAARYGVGVRGLP